MRQIAFAALLCTAQLSAAPGFAMLTDPGSPASPPLPERHARNAPQGPTLWYLLVDMALHCSGQTTASTRVCYDPAAPGMPGKTLPKLQ